MNKPYLLCVKTNIYDIKKVYCSQQFVNNVFKATVNSVMRLKLLKTNEIYKLYLLNLEINMYKKRALYISK